MSLEEIKFLNKMLDNWKIRRNYTLEELKKKEMESRRLKLEDGCPIEDIEIRKNIYKYVKLILQIDEIFSKRKIIELESSKERKLENNSLKNPNRPIIFVPTHTGRYDVETLLQTIDTQAYLFMGDPGETYHSVDGLLLDINGVIRVETNSSPDKRVAYETAKYALNNKANLAIYNEGAWNLDPLRPVYKNVYDGAARLSIETGAYVAPIGIQQYLSILSKKYYFNIGKLLDFSGATLKDTKDITRIIKESQASLKWEIWENYGKASRRKMPKSWEDGYREFIDSIMHDTENGYTIEEIERTRYHIYDSEKKLVEDDVSKYLKLLQK